MLAVQKKQAPIAGACKNSISYYFQNGEYTL